MPKKGKAVKVAPVTERKIIDVQPGYFRSSPDRIEVDVCVECSAIVFNPLKHYLWHHPKGGA
jgi:hypothetical protein